MEKRLVYADNAATTKLAPGAFEAMAPFLSGNYGNPSSLYRLGREARAAVEAAREQVASAIGAASPNEVIFTSSGTEAVNWAIIGTARMLSEHGKRHIIVSSIEHYAVLNTVKALTAEGFEVTYLPVSRAGRVDPEGAGAAIRKDTALVSVMYANNETGIIQPVAKIGEICRERGVTFFCDAVQAVGSLPVHAVRDGIGMMALSAHKFHGPKGIGALYVREGVPFQPMFYGGNQERGQRAGTENVAAIAGLAAAVHLNPDADRIRGLRDRLLGELLKIPGTALNGGLEDRMPGNINICFEKVEGESLLLMLDIHGIAVSSASACSAGNGLPSHVLLAMGLSPERANGSIRITLGKDSTVEDADYIAGVMPGIISKLRSIVNQSKKPSNW